MTDLELIEATFKKYGIEYVSKFHYKDKFSDKHTLIKPLYPNHVLTYAIFRKKGLCDIFDIVDDDIELSTYIIFDPNGDLVNI